VRSAFVWVVFAAVQEVLKEEVLKEALVMIPAIGCNLAFVRKGVNVVGGLGCS
jgi:hypothetical protein